jgi:predicted RNA-binding protein YlxR (DUF448 family)
LEGRAAYLFSLLSVGLQALLLRECARALRGQVDLQAVEALLQVAPRLLAR